jgi:DNA-binding transcriptional ArsR family regulator
MPDSPTPHIPVERVLRALADDSRRRIVERLSDGPVSVSGLAAMLEVTLTAVAQHLQVLEEAGLVATEKTGRVRTARRETAGFSVLEGWLKERRTIFEKRLDALGDLLQE